MNPVIRAYEQLFEVVLFSSMSDRADPATRSGRDRRTVRQPSRLRKYVPWLVRASPDKP